MKISELPQPYRDLALMRQEQAGNAKHVDADLQCDIIYKKAKCNSFIWDNSKDGYHFWDAINNGGTPDIPSSSLAELEAWRKAKIEKAFADVDDIELSMPDYKELYEQRTAQFNELLAKYENPTTSRNLVAECAIAFVSTKGLGFEDAWDWAEQWAAEGKRRGHIN